MFHFERGMFVFPVETKNFTNHNNIASLDTNLLDIGTSTSRMQSNQRSASCFGQSFGSSVFPCFRWRVGGPIFQMFSFFNFAICDEETNCFHQRQGRGAKKPGMAAP